MDTVTVRTMSMRMRKTSFVAFVTVWFSCLVLFVGTVSAQSKEALPAERAALARAQAVESKIEEMDDAQRRALLSRSTQDGPLSFRNFVRGGVGTGNLIQTPYVTNLNVSGGYWGGSVSPNNITWPRGSGVAYGHTMSFIVGGEVVNDGGDTLRILSESYNRGGGDQHPSGSHKYFFNAIPGYYNMRGDPATQNRLNDNAGDRALLNETGRYFVGGLNEDRNGNGELDDGEDLNGNGVLDTDLVNFREYPAQSNVPESWPAFWPPQSYVADDRSPCAFVEGSSCMPSPGLRAGRWNGFFGSFVRADQESYYVADDRDNDEFPYYPFENPLTGEPDSRGWAEGGRRGMGVEVHVRQYQWASILAEDIFVATFDVYNVSEKAIPSTIVAMLVDYDIAGSTSDNEAFFDTEDDITYQWLKRDLTINGFKVGYGGVGFLESPGIDHDGVDNDSDGMVDESQDNGIDDDGDWRPFEDLNQNGRWDEGEAINDDVGSDGVGPFAEDYPGPDPNGTEANGIPDPGEPNFEFTDNDEIDQIGLTSMVIRTPSEFDRDLDDDALFWDEYIQPGLFIVPEETADIIYVYGAGTVATQPGQRQRFSIAFFAGHDFQDMLRNKRTMQNIYDSDYNFAQPPRTPILTAVPGDQRVTLVWDQNAEESRDPIYGLDFEMYKVYRSTDPEFNEIKTITDAFGNPLLWEPLESSTGDDVQFDLANGLSGAHPVPIGESGVSYDMGTDSGLEYSYVDPRVDNGRTYYYCVVSVDQGYHPSFYETGISEFEDLAPISPTESSKVIEVDAFDRPTDVARNCAVVVPQAPALGYEEPHLSDAGIERASGDASGELEVEFLLPNEASEQGDAYEFTFTDDDAYASLDSEFLEGGRTTGFVLRNATTGDTLAAVQHPQARADLFEDKVLKARTYDGMKFTITNPPIPEPTRTEWLPNNGAVGDRGAAVPRTGVSVTASDDNTPVPRDYEIRVSAPGADTSNSLGVSARIPTNFTVWDVTDLNSPRQVPFQFSESSDPLVPADTSRGVLSPGDAINVRVFGVDFGDYRYYAESTWRFDVGLSEQADQTVQSAWQQATALYDSLAARDIRGMGARPYGSVIRHVDLDAFYSEIAGWYDETVDSLISIPGWAEMISAMPDPTTYVDAFALVRQREIPMEGDVFLLETSKPFDRDDVLRFQVQGNRMAEEMTEDMLDEIYVVPDPYVAVSSLETRNLALSGRGERRIDFRNLPSECTIRIFTLSGRQIKVIHHSSSRDRSLHSWNLQSDDGLDVAYGVYIYHVDAPGIGERIGRFSIIK